MTDHHKDCDHRKQGYGVVPDCDCGAGHCRHVVIGGGYCLRMEGHPVHRSGRRNCHVFVPGEIDPAYEEEHAEIEEDPDDEALDVLRIENAVLKGQNEVLIRVLTMLMGRL